MLNVGLSQTTAQPRSTPTDRPFDHYDIFANSIREQYLNAAFDGSPLFTTDANTRTPKGLWDTFLDGLPDEARQHYNCNACRRFVERFGGLVAITAEGKAVPVIWPEHDVPPFFQYSVAAIRQLISHAKITGVFLSSKDVWGEPVTGIWHHMSVMRPANHVFRATLKNADQMMAEKREDFKTLCSGLSEYPVEYVDQALRLLRSDSLYRSEKLLGVAEWFHKLQTTLNATKDVRTRHNLIWLAVATAPAGFCHVKSTMIGTLLDDVVAGMDYEAISRRFAAKMSPAQYQRAQSAPTAGNIAEAERVVKQLGIASSLKRRYASLSEIEALWRYVEPGHKTADSNSVFGHIAPKVRAPQSPSAPVLPDITMTWDKFSRTVMPDAISIEVQIPVTTARFAALVTAVDENAPPILDWDRADARNPVSWYYADGIDAEIKRRVLGAGGQHAGVDIRASLIWNNRNDLDLHIITPGREHIYFGNKRGRCDGWLDVDMNVRGETTTPVENTRWLKGTAPAGVYRVYVENYRFHEWSTIPSSFQVELEVNGSIFHYGGVCRPGTGPESRVEVALLDFQPGVSPTSIRNMQSATSGNANQWGVVPGSFTRVNAIALSPNLWGKKSLEHHGKHVFFLLEGCKDNNEGIGRGFFTETLRGDLRQVRATLEAYTASEPISGAAEATACGLGLTSRTPWDLVVRVRTSLGQQLYKLDRWD